MKSNHLFLYQPITLVWLVEMFTGWFDQNRASPTYSWCLGVLGLWFSSFSPYGNEVVERRISWLWLKLRNWVRKIKDKEILGNISFEINDGECVALIGPNGAGKTTLIDCLLGDKFVSSGQISYSRLCNQQIRLKQLISILPQENTVVHDLKVKEPLSFFQSIYPNSLQSRNWWLAEIFGQTEKSASGQVVWWAKTFVLFVLALLGCPKILFLDEPTAAMDTSTRQLFFGK